MIFARRSFLHSAGAAFIAPSFLLQDKVPLVDQVPPMLDHILLGCSELQYGIDFVAQHTGMRAAFGGVHPGRGTQNALLSLGERRYLEIIAPDAKQDRIEQYAAPMLEHLKQLTSPALVGWAAHPRNIEALAAQLKSAGIEYFGPFPGSRQRPDGRTLRWKTLNLKDDANGLLPFFIEWSSDSVHPSADAPSGCQLLRLELLTPDSASLAKLAQQISVQVPIAASAKPQLHAVIKGTRDTLSLNS
jgi:hypothetical protein